MIFGCSVIEILYAHKLALLVKYFKETKLNTFQTKTQYTEET